jgi:hypothetical protein
MSMTSLRRRLPLVVFILLFVLLLMIVGFACACFDDHPMQAAERVVSVLGQLLVAVELPLPVALVLFVAPLMLVAQALALRRRQYAVLQRFLY